MSYIVAITGLGILVLLVAWLPMVLKELPLSLPIVCVALGFLVFRFTGLEPPDPLTYPKATERLTELVVIVALMGAGLKLDRRIGWRSWTITWRLLAITMPISILLIAAVGWAVDGLPLPAAVLLGAALAPTDPVLASDIQVGPPKSGQEDEIRFSLTSEAGLNDGLAFPFTLLAIGLALHGGGFGAWTLEWLAVSVLWKLASAIGMGWLVGHVLALLTFRVPNRARLSRTGDGFVSLGITLIAYGATELIHGYGFLAVFIAAVALRDAERDHRYHQTLHDFIEQAERLLMMMLLVLFGGALAHGLLDPLTVRSTVAAIFILMVVRPVAGLIGLLGTTLPIGERLTVGFFGIRGIGSVYYLAYALNAAEFGAPNHLWALLGLVVLLSILIHGTTVTPVMRLIDRQRGRMRELP